MTTSFHLDDRLLAFRRAFDDAFSRAPATSVEASEDSLAIRVADESYVIRVHEISGIVASRKVVPLPSRRPELVGVAGIRGSLVTVYSLAALLGFEASAGPTSWLALVGVSASVGLGFEEFEGFLRAPAADLHTPRAEEGGRPHEAAILRAGRRALRVVDVQSVLRALDESAGAAGAEKET